MYNFGNYALLGPIKHNLEKNPEWFWAVKGATSGMDLEMARFTNSDRAAPLTSIDYAFREIAVTFAGTNIPDENGDPILKENASIEEVEAVLSEMPKDMVLEIWRVVGEANPDWGPGDQANPTKI